MDQDWVVLGVGAIAGISALRTAFHSPAEDLKGSDLHPKWSETAHMLEVAPIMLAMGVVAADILFGLTALIIGTGRIASDVSDRLVSSACASAEICSPADGIARALTAILSLAIAVGLILAAARATKASAFTGPFPRWIVWFIAIACAFIYVRTLWPSLTGVSLSLYGALAFVALYSIYTLFCEVRYRQSSDARPAAR